MFRRTVSLICVFLLIPAACVRAEQTPQTAVSRDFALRQKLASIPAGMKVDVKLHNGRKLTGRLGAVTDNSFELHQGKGANVRTQTLAFQDTKDVRRYSAVTRGSLVAIGIITAVVIAVAIFARSVSA